MQAGIRVNVRPDEKRYPEAGQRGGPGVPPAIKEEERREKREEAEGRGKRNSEPR